MKKERSSMEVNIANVTEAFARLGGTGSTSDARRALGSDYSDYVLKQMIDRNLLIKIDRDTYRLRTADTPT